MTQAETLRELASKVRRLSPHHRDPERFHVEKDEVARMLLRLARQNEGHG